MAIHFDRALHAYADQRLHAQYPAALDNHAQLTEGLQYEEAGIPHAARVQAQVDKLGILVAVAHHKALGVAQLAQRNSQLGFAAGFKAVMIAAAIIGDLLYHVTLLVHLDGKHTAIDVVIATATDGIGKCLVEHLDTVVQHIADTQYGGHFQAASAHTCDDIHQRNRCFTLAGVDGDLGVAAVGNAVIARTPGVDAIEFRAVRCTPILRRLC